MAQGLSFWISPNRCTTQGCKAFIQFSYHTKSETGIGIVWAWCVHGHTNVMSPSDLPQDFITAAESGLLDKEEGYEE